MWFLSFALSWFVGGICLYLCQCLLFSFVYPALYSWIFNPPTSRTYTHISIVFILVHNHNHGLGHTSHYIQNARVCIVTASEGVEFNVLCFECLAHTHTHTHTHTHSHTHTLTHTHTHTHTHTLTHTHTHSNTHTFTHTHSNTLYIFHSSSLFNYVYNYNAYFTMWLFS